MTNPSYQRSVLRSCTSSTVAVAKPRPSWFLRRAGGLIHEVQSRRLLGAGIPVCTNWVKQVQASLYGRSGVVGDGAPYGPCDHMCDRSMTLLRQRSGIEDAVREPPSTGAEARPVVLATLSVRVHPEAERMAI